MADAAVAAGDFYKVIFENERVRILENRMQPGERAPMHSHPDIVVVPLNGGRFRFRTPDGEVIEANQEAGQPAFYPATEHESENIGENESRGIIVELK